MLQFIFFVGTTKNVVNLDSPIPNQLIIQVFKTLYLCSLSFLA